MGKVEDMRRLREQRAEDSRRAVPGATRPAARSARAAAASPVEVAAVVVPDADDAPAGLCGHTSISGRSCTREEGHQKSGTKNHRYG
jgi:hypothetical protein